MYEVDKGYWMQPMRSVGRENDSIFFNVGFRLSEKIQKRVVTGGRQKRKIEKVTGYNKLKTVTGAVSKFFPKKRNGTVTGGGRSNPKSGRDVIYGRLLSI